MQGNYICQVEGPLLYWQTMLCTVAGTEVNWGGRLLHRTRVVTVIGPRSGPKSSHESGKATLASNTFQVDAATPQLQKALLQDFYQQGLQQWYFRLPVFLICRRNSCTSVKLTLAYPADRRLSPVEAGRAWQGSSLSNSNYLSAWCQYGLVCSVKCYCTGTLYRSSWVLKSEEGDSASLRGSQAEEAFAVAASKLWSSLPTEVQLAPSLHNFPQML